MKARITLSETETTHTRRTRKSIIVDTETHPLFRGVSSEYRIQDILYYEYFQPNVKEFLELLQTQEIEEEETTKEEEIPDIEVERICE